MPKLAETIQEPSELSPIVKELNESRGVVTYDLSDMPSVDPDQRITLGRLARTYGDYMVPEGDDVQDDNILLDITEKDFAAASPRAIERGLYIPRADSRFNNAATEQLVRVTPENDRWQYGVVFPAHEFRKVARNAKDLAIHSMAITRNANAENTDSEDVENRVGRSAAHAMEGKIEDMNKLENNILTNRRQLLIPLYRETKSAWQSHFKAKNLDRKRREFDEQLHDTVETASINLAIGNTAVKAAHRVWTKQLYRSGSSSEINAHWRSAIEMVGTYASERMVKLNISRNQCEQVLRQYEPFLATASTV